MKVKGRENMHKRFNCSIFLIALHLFLSVGAIVGGGVLMLDPSGATAELPLSLLAGSLFKSYFFPGLILFIVFGLLPFVTALGLIRSWNWKLGKLLNIYTNQYWAWTFSLYIGFALIIWITVQVAIIKEISILHFIYMMYGLVIQAVTLLPHVQQKYKNKA